MNQTGYICSRIN